MGGNALIKYGVITERMNTEEFNQIGYELGNRVFFDLTLFTFVAKCYHNKETHGDLDLLICVDKDSNINLYDYIKSTFKPQAIYSNGGVYSFDYKNFQIDFIPIESSKWDSAKTYFSYDPCGNIQGKSYHKFNLSYGWEGLFYRFRNHNGNNTADILISNDVRKIFEFGGYDYDRFSKGFDTLEEIYEFCIASKYFNIDTFKMENLTQIDRKRNRKRKSYNEFLEYINKSNITKAYEFNKDKETYLPMIDKFFPEANIFGEIKKLRDKDNEDKVMSQKFNGDMVMLWIPNLVGKELGAAMFKFKSALGNEYREFILNNDYNNIRKAFMNIYNDQY